MLFPLNQKNSGNSSSQVLGIGANQRSADRWRMTPNVLRIARNIGTKKNYGFK